ncbi:hypothetical protein [Natronococcus wangiae]|uniref:hypothetical protein n=1 Tax=Natronococcus wangiae TaxID=3068275 RepID=UPI00273E3582|nr:hypothetical protein [Natronococcus sp. AD5]
MAYSRDSSPVLSPWILDVYTDLRAHLSEKGGGSASTASSHAPAITRKEAIALLSGAGEDAVTQADADYALTRLLERGYVYEVDGELRVTDLPAAE